MSVIDGLLSAVRLLTVLPFGRREGAHAARFFPLVGWLFGAAWLTLAWAAARIGAVEGTRALLSAVLLVAASGGLSGFLHWDGLADCADAIGVRGDAARRLEVMRSSTIGAFGVTALALTALVQTAAIAVILESGAWWGLAAAPVLGRAAASLALGFRPSARSGGLGVRYAERLSVPGATIAVLAVGPLIAWRPSAWVTLAVASVAGLLAGLVMPAPVVRRIGGMTGDVAGATILLTETAVVVMAALAGGPL